MNKTEKFDRITKQLANVIDTLNSKVNDMDGFKDEFDNLATDVREVEVSDSNISVTITGLKMMATRLENTGMRVYELIENIRDTEENLKEILEHLCTNKERKELELEQ